MKKFIIIGCASLFAIGCNNQAASKDSSASTPATTDTAEKIDYAYLPADHPADYWDRGDQKNVALVLKSLKGFETGNVEASAAAFADSIQWGADGIDAKISKDSMKSMFKAAWSNMKSMKIEMDDYEAVISKDKKKEYVTLWYKQIVTDKKGKIDSAVWVDDLSIANGKITGLDEKSRKLPAKK
jgi:hypothetical protein